MEEQNCQNNETHSLDFLAALLPS